MAEPPPDSPRSTTDNGSGHNPSPPPPPPPTDPSQNPSSPFFLHPGENPGYVLVSPPLHGENYYHWSRAMIRALSSKNKIKFINGSLSSPATSDPLFDAWQRCNHMVVSWITRTLSPQISQSTASFDTARDLWLNLQIRFTRENHFRMSDLLQDLHSMKQGERSLSTFFTDMQILWDELEFLRPTLSCSCLHTCTCDLSKSVQLYKDKEHVICFLKGLNETYQPISSQILIMNPLPSISETYSMVLQQERKPEIIPDSTALAAPNFTQGRGNSSQGRGRGRNNNRTPMLCTHCNWSNHTIDTCYFKHGFPPGYRTRNTNRSPHLAATTSNDIPRIEYPSTPAKPTHNEPSFSLSKDEYQYLLQMMHSSKQDSHSAVNTVNKPSTSEATHHLVSGATKTGNYISPFFTWILDSGASDRICPYIECFTTHKAISPISVKLPNGTILYAKYSGTVFFTKDFFLHDVPFIPEFHFNLVSINKLTPSLHCQLLFNF